MWLGTVASESRVLNVLGAHITSEAVPAGPAFYSGPAQPASSASGGAHPRGAPAVVDLYLDYKVYSHPAVTSCSCPSVRFV